MGGDRGALTPHDGDLTSAEPYEGVAFADTSWDDAEAGNCLFLECAFSNVWIDGGRLRKSRFTDTELRDTRFVACDLSETGWQDVTLAGCALAGAQIYSAAMRRVTFRDCKLDSVNLRNATLTDVKFENCLLRDLDFASATFKRVALTAARWSGRSSPRSAAPAWTCAVPRSASPPGMSHCGAPPSTASSWSGWPRCWPLTWALPSATEAGVYCCDA
jgi:hypothetical protein